MRTEILLNMQASFIPYSAFWDEWKRSPHNTLNKLEKGVLEAYLRTDFTVSLKEWKNFLKQLPLLTSITEKLTASTKELDQWLIDKFITELVVIIHIHPDNNYHNIPLCDLTELNFYDGKLSGKLASILKKFGQETISDLAKAVLIKSFASPENIKIVREFLFQCKIERLVFGTLQKEFGLATKNKQVDHIN